MADEQPQRPQVAAQHVRRLVPHRQPPAVGDRRTGQVQSQGVRPFGAACGEQQQAQPFRGDLRVGDPALQQVGGRLVAGALLQPALDHHGRLVQPGGALAHVPQGLAHVVRTRVEQFELRVQQLRQPRAEGLPQPLEKPRRRLRHQHEPCRRAAHERDRDRAPETGQAGRRGADEQGQEVDLEGHQAQRGAPFPEPAAVHRAEDEDDEECVPDHHPGAQQRRQ
jgi:hypothetical protein